MLTERKSRPTGHRALSEPSRGPQSVVSLRTGTMGWFFDPDFYDTRRSQFTFSREHGLARTRREPFFFFGYVRRGRWDIYIYLGELLQFMM